MVVGIRRNGGGQGEMTDVSKVARTIKQATRTARKVRMCRDPEERVRLLEKLREELKVVITEVTELYGGGLGNRRRRGTAHRA
jgi:hypothetical protein